MDTRESRAYHVGMCPKCGSSHLRIRNQAGFERIMIYLTGQRKYLCCDCDWVFRALDRRRNPRQAPHSAAKTASPRVPVAHS